MIRQVKMWLVMCLVATVGLRTSNSQLSYSFDDLMPITIENIDHVEALEKFQLENMHDLDWSDDGNQLAVATANGIYLYNTLDFATSPTHLATDYIVYQVEFTPNNEFVAVNGSGDQNVVLIDLETQEEVKLIEGTVIAFSPNMTTLAIAYLDKVNLFEFDDNKSISTLYDPKMQKCTYLCGYYRLTFSPDGTRLFAQAGGSESPLWEIGTGEIIAYFPSGGEGEGFTAFNPDSSLLASRDRNYIRFFDTQTGVRLLSLRSPAPIGSNVSFSPDGTLLVSSGFDLNSAAGRVVVWNVEELLKLDAETADPSPLGANHLALAVLSGHASPVTHVEVQPTGVLMASASRDDGTIIIWG